MTDHVLERRFWVPRPRTEVFEFFADPTHLARVSPPVVRLSWLVAPPPRLAAGAVLDFRVRLLAVPTRWRVMIREFDCPYRFVDVQIWGPFARWEHRHRFVAGPGPDGDAGAAGTWVEDRITYQMPLGPLGDLAHGLGARRGMDALLDYRERRLRELLAGPGPPARRRPR
jgi:ligand-binding SRPBCC domain-containing protein